MDNVYKFPSRSKRACVIGVYGDFAPLITYCLNSFLNGGNKKVCVWDRTDMGSVVDYAKTNGISSGVSREKPDMYAYDYVIILGEFGKETGSGRLDKLIICSTYPYSTVSVVKRCATSHGCSSVICMRDYGRSEDARNAVKAMKEISNVANCCRVNLTPDDIGLEHRIYEYEEVDVGLFSTSAISLIVSLLVYATNEKASDIMGWLR